MSNSYGVRFGVSVPTFARNGKRLGEENRVFDTFDHAMSFAKKFSAVGVDISFGMAWLRVARGKSLSTAISIANRRAVQTLGYRDYDRALNFVHITRAMLVQQTEIADRIATTVLQARQYEEASQIVVEWSLVKPTEEFDGTPIPEISREIEF